MKKKYKKVDVFVVATPWHALLGSAIARASQRRNVFIVEESTELAKSATIEVLNGLNFAYTIIGSVQELKFFHALLKGTLNVRSYVKTKQNRIEETLDKELGNDNVSTLYLFNLCSPLQRLIKNILNPTDVIKVEDGVNDYIQVAHKYSPLFLRLLKSILIKVFCVNDIYGEKNWSMNGMPAILSLFPERIKWDGPKEDLLELVGTGINDAMRQLRGGYIDEDTGNALIIGQSLHEDNTLSLDKEIEFYCHLAMLLVENYGEVDLKLHPRSSSEKILSLKNKLSVMKTNKVRVIYPDKMPIEVGISSGKYKIIVGMWSNPVLYSKKLFGIESYTAMDLLFEMNPSLINSHLHTIHKEVREVFGDYYMDLRRKSPSFMPEKSVHNLEKEG